VGCLFLEAHTPGHATQQIKETLSDLFTFSQFTYGYLTKFQVTPLSGNSFEAHYDGHVMVITAIRGLKFQVVTKYYLMVSYILSYNVSSKTLFQLKVNLNLQIQTVKHITCTCM
jgi:hypothetical protein